MKAQATLRNSVSLSGIGVHSGNKSNIKISPARENNGIVFIRTDVDSNKRIIQLSPNNIIESAMCSKVKNEHGVCVFVIEHLLAALKICGIYNVSVELDSEEVPILDGSAKTFVDEFQKSGIVIQGASVPIFVVRDVIKEEKDNSFVEISPSDDIVVEIVLMNNRLGNYTAKNRYLEFNMNDEEVLLKIAEARTFGWFEDAEKVKKFGLANGAGPENTVIIMPDYFLYAGMKLRFSNEIISHKALDLIGDLSIFGAEIIGKIKAVNPSHMLNCRLIKKMKSIAEV